MLAIFLFVIVIFILMLGYPVAFTLSGVSILFALVCSLTNNFDLSIHIPFVVYSFNFTNSLLTVYDGFLIL